MNKNVFISYSHEDKDFVEWLRAKLKEFSVAAPTGMGTLEAFAAFSTNDKSLCARSIVNPGDESPAKTLLGKFIRN